MTEKEREHIIEWLIVMTPYSRQYFEKMKDAELNAQYVAQLEE